MCTVIRLNLAVLLKGALQAMNIKIATATMLVALTCSDISLTELSSVQAGAPDPPPPPSPQGKDFKVHNKAAEKPAEKIDEKMFPDGYTFDFEKVPHGALVKHAFRIVNMSNVPLQIVSVRFS
jgi:hypothetical protein